MQTNKPQGEMDDIHIFRYMQHSVLKKQYFLANTFMRSSKFLA